ncbi:hypothetical protein [Micromonospora marina]|uniref:hypothetical protein n=1 Tax=Micromonospora marina TaxID=307120 RepID=UPI003454E111
MPAKRNPKKSRKQPAPQVTAPNLDVLTATPPAVVLPTEPGSPVGSPEIAVPPGATTTPPRSGPPAGRQPRLNGRSQRAGQTRFYAFRRS